MGAVNAVRDWVFSSFHRYVNDGIYPDDWGGLDSSDGDFDFGEP